MDGTERCDRRGCIRGIGHDGRCWRPTSDMTIILGPGDCADCGARVWWARKGVRGAPAWRERTGERHSRCRAVA